MEFVQFPSDQQIYDAGLSRAGYKRAYETQQRTRRLEEQRAANTVPNHEGRRSDRFMAAGEAGVPISKNRLADQIRSESEEKAKELYQRIMLHKRAGIPVNFDMAEWANLLGFTQATVRQSVDYFNSDAARQRFGTPD